MRGRYARRAGRSRRTPGASISWSAMNAARRLGLWLGRVALLLAMIAFAGAVALFSAVTYLELTEGDSQSPISILTALLVPVCGALAAGCWWLFAESFKGREGAAGARRGSGPRRR